VRTLGMVLLGCLVLIVGTGLLHAAEEQEAAPIIEVEKPIYDFGQVLQGKVLKHDFRVVNRGRAPLEIWNVKPG